MAVAWFMKRTMSANRNQPLMLELPAASPAGRDEPPASAGEKQTELAAKVRSVLDG